MTPLVKALSTVITLTALLTSTPAISSSTDQVTLENYLPSSIRLDKQIPTPRSVLGYEVGEWHVRHDQLVQYFYQLAESSDKVMIEEIGRTHEQRPLINAIITSPKNLKRITEIQRQHVNLSDPGLINTVTDDLPAVVWLGYSIHGNEPSGSNASMLLAYYLVAAENNAIDELLDRLVIIVDPSLNPDGLARAATWFNSRRGQTLVADPNHLEHREAWPSGRTNHYWFDLNRDWLLLTHPESRARIKQFHNWKPNVLADFHEMGTNTTYFFQPGVPSRQNPLTPEDNFSLTAKFAEYHAKALDAAGQLYFTEERFDDYYYGKGSTYPDVNGAVGILFEQASSRGHLQESVNGLVRFPDTIKNQLITSLSTIDAALNNRKELLQYQIDFYTGALKQAERDPIKAYIFSEPDDPAKTYHFLHLLDQHQIKVYRTNKDVTSDQKQFKAGDSYIVPLNQAQYRLIKAVFETRTKFRDNTFYDVSTWTLPLAFDIPYAQLTKTEFSQDDVGSILINPSLQPGKLDNFDKNTVAFAFDWQEFYAPKVAYSLLDAGYPLRVSTSPFVASTPSGNRSFGYGTIVIPTSLVDDNLDHLTKKLQQLVNTTGISIHSINKGLTAQGIDLGSPSLIPLQQPKVLAIGGPGISSLEVGEVWQLLDQHVGMPLTIVPYSQLNQLNLNKYTHIVMVDGSYNSLELTALDSQLSSWINQGGSLVAIKRGAEWAIKNRLIRETQVKKNNNNNNNGQENSNTAKRLAYSTRSQRMAEQLVSGAIFQAELDITHPLAFGYKRNLIAGFQNRNLFLTTSKNPYNTIAQYTKEPLLSGYISPQNLERISKSAMIIGSRQNRGSVVLMANNPNFRGFWLGTQKLFINSIFMSTQFQSSGSFDEHEHH